MVEKRKRKVFYLSRDGIGTRGQDAGLPTSLKVAVMGSAPRSWSCNSVAAPGTNGHSHMAGTRDVKAYDDMLGAISPTTVSCDCYPRSIPEARYCVFQ